MSIHFEELWEQCEQLHLKSGGNESISTIMDELSMKINLYKMIDSKTEVPKEDRQNIKSRTLGEILLTLTHLSLKENINVFEALSIAAQHRNNSSIELIPKDLRLPGF
jgi:divalent metal cation (Fe/Co/Zn/Cd) transporter